MKRTTLLLTATASAALMSVTACGSNSDPLSTSSSSSTASAGAGSSSTSSGGGGGGGGSVVVGSANFPENALLAEIYAGALKAKGVQVKKKLNIGSRETYIPALKDGSIDLIPEYTGVLTQYFSKTLKAVSSDGVYSELKASLPSTLTVLDKSAAEDKDAVAVTKATAAKDHLKTIADLQPIAKNITLGGPPEWKTRATGVPGLKKVYGLTFKSFRPLDTGGPLSVQALKNGQVDAVNLFTTDPSIAANSFVILGDPKNLYAAQNVVPLITKSKSNPTIASALNAVSAKLDTKTLGELVKQVVVEKKDASAVAKDFLSKNSLG
jgi:osmoprotectant transport system substrate-binding protein